MDDSFDGTFNDNIKSNAYKSQFSNKRNAIIINVSGINWTYLETQYAVVKHVAKKNKYNMILDPVPALNFDIAWVDGIAKQ
jgi:repressor of nif and glnA expression